MNRNEARSKVVDLLLGENNSNNYFYANAFEKYGGSEETPISPIYMNHVNEKNNIIITEEVHKELLKIRNITRQTNNEVAYLIFGEEKPNGTIWLDKIVSDYNPAYTRSANFRNIDHELNNYVDQIENGQYDNSNKRVLCHGHTHGITNVSDNFSFGDLIAYVELTNLHPLFKQRKVETLGMMMPPSGDYNFIMYENNNNYEGFYTFPNVYMRQNNGDGFKLPTYSNGNYITKELINR